MRLVHHRVDLQAGRVRGRAHLLGLLRIGDGVHLGRFEADLPRQLEAIEDRELLRQHGNEHRLFRRARGGRDRFDAGSEARPLPATPPMRPRRRPRDRCRNPRRVVCMMISCSMAGRIISQTLADGSGLANADGRASIQRPILLSLVPGDDVDPIEEMAHKLGNGSEDRYPTRRKDGWGGCLMVGQGYFSRPKVAREGRGRWEGGGVGGGGGGGGSRAGPAAGHETHAPHALGAPFEEDTGGGDSWGACSYAWLFPGNLVFSRVAFRRTSCSGVRRGGSQPEVHSLSLSLCFCSRYVLSRDLH